MFCFKIYTVIDFTKIKDGGGGTGKRVGLYAMILP
jgi:hypothetical protein